jgi:hypothetical protein
MGRLHEFAHVDSLLSHLNECIRVKTSRNKEEGIIGLYQGQTSRRFAIVMFLNGCFYDWSYRVDGP